MSEHAAGELVRHLIESGRAEIVGRYERKDGRSGIGGPVHVANVNFVERRLTDAKHQRALFFEADIGSALDEMRSNAVGYTGKRADAAGQNDHGVSRIGTAGDVGPDIGVRLLMNFARCLTEQLADEVVTAAEFEFFGQDAKRAV